MAEEDGSAPAVLGPISAASLIRLRRKVKQRGPCRFPAKTRQPRISTRLRPNPAGTARPPHLPGDAFGDDARLHRRRRVRCFFVELFAAVEPARDLEGRPLRGGGGRVRSEITRSREQREGGVAGVGEELVLADRRLDALDGVKVAVL